MGRNKSIEPNVLYGLLQAYYDETGKDYQKLRIPAIGNYIRSKGHDVKDYTLRRMDIVKKFISDKKNSSSDYHINTVAVYRDLDFDSFISQNNSRIKLIEALKERDKYYKKVTESASVIFEENNKLKETIRSQKENIKALKEEKNKYRQDNESNLVKLKQYISENKKLRNIIETYVYPEIANELLKESGLLTTTAEIIDSEIMKSNIITADKDVSAIESNIIKGLFKSI